MHGLQQGVVKKCNENPPRECFWLEARLTTGQPGTCNCRLYARKQVKCYLENIGMMMFPPCHVSKLKKLSWRWSVMKVKLIGFLHIWIKFFIIFLSHQLTKNVVFFNFIFRLPCLPYRVFLHDVMAAMWVSQNNETAAMLVSQTNPVGVELFQFFCKRFLFQ